MDTGWNVVAGIVMQATFLGAQHEYRVRVGGTTGGQEITVRQQNMGVLTDVAALEGHDIGLDRVWQTFGPGERVSLVWRHEASLILREPGADRQQVESAGKQASAPYASKV